MNSPDPMAAYLNSKGAQWQLTGVRKFTLQRVVQIWPLHTEHAAAMTLALLFLHTVEMYIFVFFKTLHYIQYIILIFGEHLSQFQSCYTSAAFIGGKV